MQRLRVDLTHDADYDVARHDLRRPRRMEAGPDCGAELDRLQPQSVGDHSPGIHRGPCVVFDVRQEQGYRLPLLRQLRT